MSTQRVSLAPVTEAEYDDFFAMLELYDRELEAYETVRPDHEIEFAVYRQSILDDMEGRELLWIVEGDGRAGFAMTRTSADWPDEDSQIMSIAEFYIVPHRRRSGVGRAAVELLLADHRRRGTFLVQASIMRENAAAREFWDRLGFELQFLQTSRRP